MNQTLLTHLSEITEEEQAILSGSTQIQRELYTTDDSAVVDSHRLLAQNSDRSLCFAARYSLGLIPYASLNLR